jgi:hypothetical protein
VTDSDDKQNRKTEEVPAVEPKKSIKDTKQVSSMQTTEKDKEQKEVFVAKKREEDILLYHPLSLVLDIYVKVLENLGYSVDKVMSETLFMERLEAKKYKGVIYYGQPFINTAASIIQKISDNGAKQLVIIKEDDEAQYFKCDIYKQGDDVTLLKKKLNKLLK